ncbi:MAG: enoyl-CoA hydratase/isomerase family protein [Pseudonocardiaceae bacterium]|nr:enoyl-CoA hydratase/isomerase family protein [Pseudonocardiaceae bacterium]
MREQPDATPARLSGPDGRGLCTITLDRPQKANALDSASVAAIAGCVEEADRRNAAVLSLEAAGRSFCAGFDLDGIDNQSEGDLLVRFVRIAILLERVSTAKAITVANVRGPAFGAGGDLALACDYRIGGEDSRFRFPGVRFGVALGVRRLREVAGTDTATRLGGGHETVGGAEALRLGLLTHLADESESATVLDSIVERWGPTAPSGRAAFTKLSRQADPDEDLAALVRGCAGIDLAAQLRHYAHGPK